MTEIDSLSTCQGEATASSPQLRSSAGWNQIETKTRPWSAGSPEHGSTPVGRLFAARYRCRAATLARERLFHASGDKRPDVGKRRVWKGSSRPPAQRKLSR